jgi:hypothetical protein
MLMSCRIISSTSLIGYQITSQPRLYPNDETARQDPPMGEITTPTVSEARKWRSRSGIETLNVSMVKDTLEFSPWISDLTKIMGKRHYVHKKNLSNLASTWIYVLPLIHSCSSALRSSLQP